MSLTNINSDWMSNASSGLCACAYPLGWPPGLKTLDIYIYTLAQIRLLHCTISSLALRRSAITADINYTNIGHSYIIKHETKDDICLPPNLLYKFIYCHYSNRTIGIKIQILLPLD